MEPLGLLRESTSAAELESMDITMTEESDEQAEFSWKTSNASKCILRCEGEEAQELPGLQGCVYLLLGSEKGKGKGDHDFKREPFLRFSILSFAV